MADDSDMLALRVYLDENYDFMVRRLPSRYNWSSVILI